MLPIARTAAILLGLLMASTAVAAEVVSETLYFLQPDGRHYLIERSIRSDSTTHRFHLPPGVNMDDLRYVSPSDYQWESRPDGGVSLRFDSGSFTLIYAGQFRDELQRQADGSWRYRSWQGKKEENANHFGSWYAPGNFDRYGFAWLLPKNIEILDYHSNVEGRWTQRPQALGFYAENVNDVIFEIRYRVHADDRPGNSSSVPAGADDQDGVPETRDLCPQTPPGARVDKVGCALDADRDGIPDGIDRCPATEEESRTDKWGCPLTNEAGNAPGG
ncbi:MAG: hypothetical protein D6720_09735 [Gammaproteobacteria bacterium]|nr:MAG: hypothetical protein D6720_09735 [Gammaproteobacteria bacterium]